MIWVGRVLKAHLVLPSALGRNTFHQTRCLQAMEHVQSWGRHLWGHKHSFCFLFHSPEGVFWRKCPTSPPHRVSAVFQAPSKHPCRLLLTIPARPAAHPPCCVQGYQDTPSSIFSQSLRETHEDQFAFTSNFLCWYHSSCLFTNILSSTNTWGAQVTPHCKNW